MNPVGGSVEEELDAIRQCIRCSRGTMHRVCGMESERLSGRRVWVTVHG
ncbi:MAG: hypothetical protein ACLR3S_09100 [Clostridium fessum]